jgi:hypothetical protein
MLCAREKVRSAVLLHGSDGAIRLTVRATDSKAPDAPTVIESLLLGANAPWIARLGRFALEPRPLRHDSPLARRTGILNTDALPPLVRLGDALIQTAPRLGQGIAQITEHLTAIDTALRGGRPMHRLQAGLDVLADRRWNGMAMLAGLGRLAA